VYNVFIRINILKKRLLENKRKKEKKMAMSENSQKVLAFLKANVGVNVTAADIAEALDLQKRSVDGIVTSALQRKGLAVRTPAEVEVKGDDGTVTHKQVKFITLTDEGLAFDPTAAAE
jgi:hypothetical protein